MREQPILGGIGFAEHANGAQSRRSDGTVNDSIEPPAVLHHLSDHRFDHARRPKVSRHGNQLGIGRPGIDSIKSLRNGLGPRAMHAHNCAGSRRLGRNLESDRSTRTSHENNRARVNERHERPHLRAVRIVFRPRAIALIPLLRKSLFIIVNIISHTGKPRTARPARVLATRISKTTDFH